MFVSKVVNFRYINNNYERSLSKIKGKEQLTWDKGLLLVNFWGKCLKKQLKHLKRKDTWIFLTKKSLELFNAHFLWCPTCKHRAIDKVSRVHTRTWERFKLNMFIIQLKKWYSHHKNNIEHLLMIYLQNNELRMSCFRGAINTESVRSPVHR